MVKRYVKMVDGAEIWRFEDASLRNRQTIFDITTIPKDYKLALPLYELR